MDKVFTEFSSLLNMRFQSEVYTTEDSIRYSFFIALIRNTSLAPHEVILEYPHPQIEGAQIDTVIPYYEKRCIAIEFKFDREIPSGQAIPKPQKAGALFKDIYRLSKFSSRFFTTRLVVYCTDIIMTQYFSNPRNQHRRFFELPKGESLRIDSSYIVNKAKTFKNAIGGIPVVDLESLWKEKLSNSYELRIYKVIPVQSAYPE